MKPKQIKFLEALLTESTVTSAARKAGIARNTAYSYISDPEFKEELEKRRNECLEDAVRYMNGKMSDCLETLVSIIKSPKTSAQVKVNAVIAFFSCRKTISDDEVVFRIQKLEKIAEGENTNDFKGNN